MKIRTKLQTIAVLPLSVFLLAGAVLFFLTRSMERIDARDYAANEIIRTTSDLIILTYEYGISRSDRPKVQWTIQHDALARMVRAMGSEFSRLADAGRYDEISAGLDKVFALFTELCEYDGKNNSAGTSRETMEFRSNIVNRLIMELQSILPLSEKLHEQYVRDAKRYQKMANLLIGSAILALGIVIALISWGSIRGITRSLSEFQKGMHSVASGSLDYRIRSLSEDEIGELSRGFDAMTEQLNAVTVLRDDLQKQIAERKRVEEELRSITMRHEMILNSAGEGIYGTDAGGNIIFMNHAAQDMLGFDLPQVLGKNSHELLHHTRADGSPYPADDCPLYKSLTKRETCRGFDEVFWRNDGRMLPVEYINSPIFDRDIIVGAVVVFRDITERKLNEAINASRLHLVRFSLSHALDELLEETLNEAEKLTGSLIGFYHFVEDDQRTLTLQNWSRRTKAEFCKAEGKGLHYPIADAGVWAECVHDRRPLIHNDYESLPYRKGLPEGHAQIIRELVVPVVRGDRITAILGVGNKGSLYNEKDVEIISILADLAWEIAERKKAEDEVVRLNEELEKRVNDRTVDLQNKSGELQNSQAALMNIVEDMNVKTAELEEANLKLKELDRLKSLFIASMSHELRTPLNSIIGFSSIILDGWIGPLNDEQKNNMSIVLRSGKHLLSLINDVIDISKVEAGKIEVSYEDFDLYDVISEAVTLFKKDIKDKGLEMDVEAVHLAMHTDRRRLLQSVVNLISNAVKFTEKGTIRIQNSESRIQNKDFVEISVSDTGMGIKKEDIPRLFGAFVRVHSPQVLTVKGTGLGLYLTKKIVIEILNGEIAVESEYGKGSRFVMRIPVKCKKGVEDEEGARNRR